MPPHVLLYGFSFVCEKMWCFIVNNCDLKGQWWCHLTFHIQYTLARTWPIMIEKWCVYFVWPQKLFVSTDFRKSFVNYYREIWQIFRLHSQCDNLWGATAESNLIPTCTTVLVATSCPNMVTWTNLHELTRSRKLDLTLILFILDHVVWCSTQK